MGAVAPGGLCVFNEEVIELFHISEKSLQSVIDRETKRIDALNQLYRQGRNTPDIKSKTVIVIDDGIATGMTMRVAVDLLHRGGAEKIIVAVPVAPLDTCENFANLVDEVICLQTPRDFYGVGFWYEDFSQTTDEEVAQLLQ